MMTWEQLAERIATMPPEQLRDSAQFDAIRFVGTTVSLGFGEEEAPEEVIIATGCRDDTIRPRSRTSATIAEQRTSCPPIGS